MRSNFYAMLPGLLNSGYRGSQPEQEAEKEKRPPWETEIIDIPKSQRRGKTWEEIREIKKRIWEQRHGETAGIG